MEEIREDAYIETYLQHSQVHTDLSGPSQRGCREVTGKHGHDGKIEAQREASTGDTSGLRAARQPFERTSARARPRGRFSSQHHPMLTMRTGE